MRMLYKRLIACLVLACLVFLIGCGAEQTAAPTTSATEIAIEATDATITTEEVTTEATVPLATVSNEDLQGVWIAAADPVISDDTTYTRVTKAGYYEFSGQNFTFTQVQMVERSGWSQNGEGIVHKGTYELSGDILTLHYTEEAGQSVDYTEIVSMVVDRSCADMCVRTPDHPKLGQLMFFRKARSGDPVNAIVVLLSNGV